MSCHSHSPSPVRARFRIKCIYLHSAVIGKTDIAPIRRESQPFAYIQGKASPIPMESRLIQRRVWTSAHSLSHTTRATVFNSIQTMERVKYTYFASFVRMLLRRPTLLMSVRPTVFYLIFNTIVTHQNGINLSETRTHEHIRLLTYHMADDGADIHPGSTPAPVQ